MNLYILTTADLDELWDSYMDTIEANTTTSCTLLGVA